MAARREEGTGAAAGEKGGKGGKGYTSREQAAAAVDPCGDRMLQAPIRLPLLLHS